MLRCFSTFNQSIRSLQKFPFQHCRTFQKRSGPELPFNLERFEKMNGLANTFEKYNDLSREELIARIEKLEKAVTSSNKSHNSTSAANTALEQNQKKERKFDISRYPCRKIALRFSYDGEQYSGLEIQPLSGSVEGNTIETVEGVLWRALCEARLVDENVGMQGVNWSRCGRTDRGVSAAGQVVAFWARSRKVDQWPMRKVVQRVMEEVQVVDDEGEEGGEVEAFTRQSWRERIERKAQESLKEEEKISQEREDRIAANPNSEELPYVVAINRLLPKSIRVQAWSPVSPAFNARFDCQYRHYKYFFSRGAPFVNVPSSSQNNHGPIPPLDIHSMRLAAQKFLGEHDFRNFCKVDPSKQMDNFTRRIDGISIDPVSSSTWSNTSSEAKRFAKEEENRVLDNSENHELEQMYVLNLRGTAFLYHQVRHITSILFLVGAGLEKPSIVDELLNVRQGGVFVDRLLSAKVNGLLLKDDHDDTLETTLPTFSKDSELSMTQTYQKVRKEVKVGENGDSLNLNFDANHIAKLEPLRSLYVFDRKPIYEMAMDRPLMLWECGFHEKDIEWRSGTFDGTLSNAEEQQQSKSNADINGPSSLIRAQLHAIWDAQRISAEMYKHFALALPSDQEDEKVKRIGYIPANSSFSSASFPALQSSILKAEQEQREKRNERKVIVPLGYGRFKNAPYYTSLRNAIRQATPEEKNQKWKETKGQRRAEKAAAAAKGQE